MIVALEQNISISWARALHKVIQGLVKKRRNKIQRELSAITCLVSYLAHLYEFDGCLPPEEQLKVDRLPPYVFGDFFCDLILRFCGNCKRPCIFKIQ